MGTQDNAPESGHKPYIADEVKMPEFTWSAVVLGTSLGLIFAASSLYLVLKIGMTVSASIPVSVLAITVFRALSRAFRLRRATILENNIVQTAGSAGESIAFGVGVTMPTLLLLGFDMDITRIMVVSILGGILGILAMIPLRRAFIVKMHGRPGQPGTLLYPEGTACAQVLISGEKGGTTGKTVFVGFGIAFVHKFITEGMGLMQETVTFPLKFINKAAQFAQAMASELLGVGYIIGLRTSSIMMAGAVLGYLVIIPIIYFIGEHAPTAIFPGGKPIKDMSISEIRNNYLLYIGAGCVATAGIISMCKTLPIIVRSIAGGLRGVGAGVEQVVKRRTEDDMSMRVVLLGSLGLIVLLAIFLSAEVGPIAAVAGALLVIVFGFLFVTVSARLTGEIGSSSNPISGMTTATLMLTCLIFLTLGWRSSTDRLLALSVAAVVCIASSNGGTVAQSLKTGFLVGGTPKLMQYAILIGAVVSALVIGGTLIAFNESRAVVSKKKENVPDYTLTKEEMGRLKDTVKYEGTTYKVWHTRNDNLTQARDDFKPRAETVELAENKPGIYYVDTDSGKLEALKDNTIMGHLTESDDGTYKKREFDAPKTQVMGIVINGVLKGNLNWSMIAIGALIAVMLELCGVSALAFAVGVYVPIQYSTPIFVGGIVRWLVDRQLAKKASTEAETRLQEAVAAAGDDPVARLRAEQEAKAQAEIDAIRKSETSGGVLLASGFIAGGSIGGVLLGFLAFNDEWPDDMREWEHRKVKVTEARPLADAAEDAARAHLGLPPKSLSSAEYSDINSLVHKIADLKKEDPRIKKLAEEIAKQYKEAKPKDDAEKAKNEKLQKLANEIAGFKKKDPQIKELTHQLAEQSGDAHVQQLAATILMLNGEDRRFDELVEKFDKLKKDDRQVTKVGAEIAEASSGDAKLEKLSAALAGMTKDPRSKALAGVLGELSKEDSRIKPLADELAKKCEENPDVKELAEEIADLSKDEPYRWVKVPKGTTLKMPEGKDDYEADSDTYLKDVAKKTLGRERAARKIYDKNSDIYGKDPPVDVPEGAELKLPTTWWPAVLGFLALAAILLLVGIGYLFPPAPEEQANGGSSDTPPNEGNRVTE